jgi:uncharacterized protein (TIGR00369 family)
MPKMMERLEKTLRGEYPPPPIARLIGFRLASLEAGQVVVEFDADEAHANPMGTLHGGVLCDVAVAAMGMAYASQLDEDESFTTLELRINFFRPVWKDHLRATGRVVNRGKTVGYVECEVTNSKGALVAKASSTCITLRGELAKGR